MNDKVNGYLFEMKTRGSQLDVVREMSTRVFIYEIRDESDK